MTLESRSPHDLELMSLDIEMHDVGAGRAAAVRLRPPEDEHHHSAAFDDEIPTDEAAAKLAVVIAAVTPLRRGKFNEDERPILPMKTGQHSTHLFHLQLPSESDPPLCPVMPCERHPAPVAGLQLLPRMFLLGALSCNGGEKLQKAHQPWRQQLVRVTCLS